MRRHALLPLLAAALCFSGCKSCQKEVPPPTPPTPSAPRTEAAPKDNTGAETIAQGSGDHVDEWGAGLQMVLDGAGQALLAYLEHDPQQPEDRDAHQVTFIGRDAQKNAYRAPLRVAGAKAGLSEHPLAMARDVSSGALALAFIEADAQKPEDSQITVAISRDGGLTWKLSAVRPPEGGEARSPSLALAGGQLTLAYLGHDLMVVRGALDAAPSTWSPPKALPAPAGYESHHNAPPSVAVDAEGKPAVVSGVSKDGKMAVAFQRLDGSPPVIALETRAQNDAPNQVLVFQGTQPRILATVVVGDGKKDDEALWLLRSDDGGKSFAKPQRLPGDGGRRMVGPIALALSPSNHLAATVQGNGGSTEGVKCGSPLLTRSDDGKAFTTCNPPGLDVPDQPYISNTVARVGFAGEKLVLAFFDQKSEHARRLEVWRER